MSVNLPLIGVGDLTATVATEAIGGVEFQFIKIADGNSGSSFAAEVENTTPGSSDYGLIVRSIGTTAFTQAAVLVAGSSASMIGQVVVSSANSINLALGTTANYQMINSLAYSSGAVTRSSVSTTVDIQLIGANASRKGLIVANRSTAQTVGVGFSTASVTTALANVDIFIPPSGYIAFGAVGGLPLYQGPLRGINLTSTAVAGSVGVTEFS